jgi:septin family protein
MWDSDKDSCWRQAERGCHDERDVAYAEQLPGNPCLPHSDRTRGRSHAAPVINTLFSTELATGKDHSRRHAKQLDKTVEVDIIKAELEEKQFKVKLTVIDTPGFGDYVNNRVSWTPIVDFIDDQHELYMRQEQQPERREKTDLRVHACLYFIRPTGHTLKPLDIEIMKRLGTRVNLIPVVAKADTLSPNDLAIFKQRVSCCSGCSVDAAALTSVRRSAR